MKTRLCRMDFLSLRMAVDQLKRQSGREPETRLDFPVIKGGKPEKGEVLEAGEVLSATLRAVASATGELRRSGSVALGKEPVSINLTGELLGFSERTKEIFIRIRPEGKGRKNGKKA